MFRPSRAGRANHPMDDFFRNEIGIEVVFARHISRSFVVYSTVILGLVCGVRRAVATLCWIGFLTMGWNFADSTTFMG